MLGRHVIRLVPEQERADLLYACQWVAWLDHADIDHPIIEIGIRRDLNEIGVAACIAYNNL